MIGPTRSDWRVLLLATLGGAGSILCLALAASMTGYAFAEPVLHPIAAESRGAQDFLGISILSAGMGLVGVILLLTAMASLRAIWGRADPSFDPKPMRWWSVVLWISVWLAASVLAQALYGHDGGRLVIPVLHVVAIACPIYLLIRVAIGGIRGGSKLRLWGSLSSGMLLGTGIAATVEIGLLVLAGIAAGVYLVLNPDHILALQQLVLRLTHTTGPEETLAVLGPAMSSPIAFLAALAAVSLASPIVEEIAKSVPVLAMYQRVVTGAEGFWAGALSGAGFALLEGLMVSANAGEGAAPMLMLRAGSSLMHVVASGLAGWGIGSFRASGRARLMALGYAGAMGIHALWNTVVVAIAYGGLRMAYGTSRPDVPGLVLSIGGVMLLVLLIALLPVGLIGLNGKFRAIGYAPITTEPDATSPSPAGATNQNREGV